MDDDLFFFFDNTTTGDGDGLDGVAFAGTPVLPPPVTVPRPRPAAAAAGTKRRRPAGLSRLECDRKRRAEECEQIEEMRLLLAGVVPPDEGARPKRHKKDVVCEALRVLRAVRHDLAVRLPDTAARPLVDALGETLRRQSLASSAARMPFGGLPHEPLRLVLRMDALQTMRGGAVVTSANDAWLAAFGFDDLAEVLGKPRCDFMVGRWEKQGNTVALESIGRIARGARSKRLFAEYDQNLGKHALTGAEFVFKDLPIVDDSGHILMERGRTRVTRSADGGHYVDSVFVTEPVRDVAAALGEERIELLSPSSESPS